MSQRPCPCRQIACYGCLDVLTKVVFGYILMSSYSIIDRVHTAEENECAPTCLQCLHKDV